MKQWNVALKSVFSLVSKMSKYQKIYIKMILIHEKISVDYKKTKIGAIVTNFCSDFDKKPSNF
jgi:hypothetical protein